MRSLLSRLHCYREKDLSKSESHLPEGFPGAGQMIVMMEELVKNYLFLKGQKSQRQIVNRMPGKLFTEQWQELSP